MDRLTGMEVFVAAVEEGSFAAAARRFGLSASMAGKYVSAIESELNARLLQRTTRRLSMTDVGQIYYVRCKRLLVAYEEANRVASEASSTARGTLKIAAPVTFGAMHLGDVLARYMDDHPHVNVEVSLSDRYVDLLESGVDIAIRIGRLPDSELVAQRLAPCRMVVCASPEFLQRHGIPLTPEDLNRTPRLAFSEAVSTGDWTLTDPENRTHLIEGPCRLAANNTQMLLAAALAGVGIAYGPTFVFGEAIAQKRLLQLLPEYRTAPLAIYAVYPSTRHVPLKVRHLLEYLAAAFDDLPPWDRTADQHITSVQPPHGENRRTPA